MPEKHLGKTRPCPFCILFLIQGGERWEEEEERGSSTLSYVGVGADVDEPVEAETDATVGARVREPVRAVRVDDRQTNEAPLQI